MSPESKITTTMRRRRITTIRLALSLIASSTVLFAQSGEKLGERIDTYLSESAKNHFAGTVLVANGGEIILSKGYGSANADANSPNSPQTVFNIGSVTKQFTSAAILKLVELGKLNTTDTLDQLFENVPADKKDITVHQLLTHTAGISPDALDQRNEPLDRNEFLNKFFAMELASKPGGNHDYANPGYMMLAAIVEQQAKQSFESFLYSHLLKPAGLERTGYTRPQWTETTLAHGYYYHLGQAKWADWGTTPEHWDGNKISWYDIGKGDLHSNTLELYKWHQALESNKVLSAAMRKLLETPHVAESESGQSHYGYGWSIVDGGNRGKIVAHNGSNGVFFSDFVRYVDKGVVVIVQSNTALSGRDGIAWQIGEIIFDPNHTARPVSPSEYELINEYIQTHSPDTIDALMARILESSGRALDSPWIFNNIGRIQYQAKNCDWAIALLEKNTALFPDDGRMSKTLGDAYEACGQPLRAQEVFEKAEQR